MAGQEYHYQIADEGRTGSKPAAMRNSPPQAALWTDGHRSAPSLAVFDAELYPAQVVLAHPPASLQPSSRRASRQRTYPAAGYEIFKVAGITSNFGLDPVPARFPAFQPVPLNRLDRNMALGICRCPKGQTFKVIVALNGNN